MMASTSNAAVATPRAATNAMTNGCSGGIRRPGRPKGLSSSTCASIRRAPVSNTASSAGAASSAASSAGGEELPDGCVRSERLEQLEIGAAAGRVRDVQHRLAHTLRLIGLAAGDDQPEQ